MVWTEKNFKNDFSKIKQALEAEFRKTYNINDEQHFILPNGSTMKIVLFKFGTNHYFVMDYRSETDWDDGDQYDPSDYSSLDELFADMLAETQISYDE